MSEDWLSGLVAPPHHHSVSPSTLVSGRGLSMGSVRSTLSGAVLMLTTPGRTRVAESRSPGATMNWSSTLSERGWPTPTV